ncbi:MAG: hypothetical protein KDA32_00690 [Phycisphaerales bacterium]|nr:hypothetical protein [Phycisphaerales bacterium]
MAVRIAMWSGPRNISTAMMRAWESRDDAAVVDEPLYAHYLLATGADHPGRDEVLATHDADWRSVVARLLGPISGGRAILFQKHMAHHLLDSMSREWLTEMRHAFLIRHPREMLISLSKNLPDPKLADTGLPQQVEILEYVECRAGAPAPILDARDVLENPRGMLTALCAALAVPFQEAMLSWPPGRRATDGVWAPHWYANVERSTGFAPYRPPTEPLAPALEPLLAECMPYYERLRANRLTASVGG